MPNNTNGIDEEAKAELDWLCSKARRSASRLARAGGLGVEDGEDAFQDSAEFIFRDASRISGYSRAMKIRLIRGRIVNELARRNRWRAQPVAADDENADPEARLPEPLTQQPTQLRNLLMDEFLDGIARTLTPTQLEVFDLRVFDRLKFAQIGRIRGTTAQAARQAFQNAVDQIRRQHGDSIPWRL